MASSTHTAFKRLTDKMKSLTVQPKENNCQLVPTKTTTFEPHPWMNIAAMIVSREEEEPFKRSSLLSSHDSWMKHFIDQGSTLCESNPVKSMVHNEYIPHGSLQTLTSICYFLLTHPDAGSNGYRLNIKGVIMSMTSPISQDMSADLGESIRYVYRGDQQSVWHTEKRSTIEESRLLWKRHRLIKAREISARESMEPTKQLDRAINKMLWDVWSTFYRRWSWIMVSSQTISG